MVFFGVLLLQFVKIVLLICTTTTSGGIFLRRGGCSTIYMIIKDSMSYCLYILSKSYLCFLSFYVIFTLFSYIFERFSFVTYMMHDFLLIENFIYEYCIYTILFYTLFPPISSSCVLATPPQIHSFMFCKYNSYTHTNVFVCKCINSTC